jgi:predicted RNase H-like nuclease (RuvC/YqgF family)
MSMPHGFELLEEKVKKAAELVKRLRRENEALAEGQARLQGRLEEAERTLATAQKQRKSADEGAHQLETLGQELKVLRQEREEVRGRIEKLLEVLDGLD